MKRKVIDRILFIIAVVIVACYLLFVFVYTSHVKTENDTLKAENEELREKTSTEVIVELEPCYLCGETVKIQPVNESFYIECESCGLETTFFKSKSELVSYWNKDN